VCATRQPGAVRDLILSRTPAHPFAGASARTLPR
jgi:hypothetical protein